MGHPIRADLFRRNVVGDELAAEFAESAAPQVHPHIGHDLQEKVAVVDADQPQAQDLVHMA
jgi:hypothetical protein